MAAKTTILSAVVAAALVSGAPASRAGQADAVQNGQFLNPVYSTTGAGYNAGDKAPLPFFYGASTYLCQANSSNQKACNGANFHWLDTGSGWLDYITTPGAAGNPLPPPAGVTNASHVLNEYPTDWTNFPGGNVYVADAGKDGASTYLYEAVSLTKGAYDISFWQAGGSFYLNHAGDAAYWQVALSKGAPVYNWNNGNSDFALPAGAIAADSAAMQVGNGAVNWEKQTVVLDVPTDGTWYLSFNAQGAGLPPFALLADVSMIDPPAVPEPAVWAMMALGFAGLGWRARRRRSGAAA